MNSEHTDGTITSQHDLRFGLILLLLCLLPLVAGVVWMNRNAVPPPPNPPLVVRLDDRTTVELLAISYADYGSDVFWSPNGVQIDQGDLNQIAGGGNPDTRSLYFRAKRDSTSGSDDAPHVYPSPLLTKVSWSASWSSRWDKTNNEHQTNMGVAFVPTNQMFRSTDVEVWYASEGVQDICTLSPEQPEKQLIVRGQSVTASVSQANGVLSVKILPLKLGRNQWSLDLIDLTGRKLNGQGQNHSERDGLSYEFATTGFSKAIIRSVFWDRKVTFSDISYTPGIYTHPRVSAVERMTDDK